MRTGPLVERGAKVSRVTQAGTTTLRPTNSKRIFNRPPQLPPLPSAAPHTLFKSSCAHLECRLPINLREFLADQMGAMVGHSDHAVLDLAANADPATLSKLARAIRRYSTTRAQEVWEECVVPLVRFVAGKSTSIEQAVVCLKCVKADFEEGAAERHSSSGCVVLTLRGGYRAERRSMGRIEAEIVGDLRRAIEEFRRLRAAFGLPHFELDSYVRNHQVTFTWRPLS